MHASVTSEVASFFCSDGMERKPIDPDEGNISLALNVEDGARGETIFAALAEGGTVKRAIEPAFWGGRFGNVVDKFGNDWMMTLP
jgi:PhnB protein